MARREALHALRRMLASSDAACAGLPCSSSAALPDACRLQDAAVAVTRQAGLPPSRPASAMAGRSSPPAAAAQQRSSAYGFVGARGLCSRPEPSGSAAPEAEAAAPPAADAKASAAAAEPTGCWNCPQLAARDQFFCGGCGAIQPARPNAQYFKVFDIDPPTFDVDAADLDRRYKALQKRLHPDRWTTASEAERRFSDQQSAIVNTAYDVLSRPLRRAHHLLQALGYGACEGLTITDPGLLTAVMEAREEVEEAAGDAQRLRALLEGVAAREAACLPALAAAFREGRLDAAAELTTRLRYISRLRAAIEDQLEPERGAPPLGGAGPALD